VLMYAAELLIRHSGRTRGWLWGTTTLALAVLAVRGLAPFAG